MRRLKACLIALLLVAMPVQAHAMHKDTRSVLVAGAYGIVAGTLVGLATLPLNHDTRSVFVGSSVGLYLGLAVGFYYIWNRNDPGNPLASREGETVESMGAGLPPALSPQRHALAPAAPPLLDVRFPVYRF